MKARPFSFLYAAGTAALGATVLLTLAACNDLFPNRSPGEKLYRKHCADCHGLDGAGNTPRYMGNPWADLTDGNWKQGGDPASLANSTRNGVFGQMPSFKQLSDAEVQQIVDHVRVLRGEKLPQPAR